MKFLKIQILHLVVVTILSSMCIAQETGVTGFPVFAPLTGGPDILNLSSLNEHWTFPVVSKNGRGIPYQFSLNYDSTPLWILNPNAQFVFYNNNWGWSNNNGQYGYISYTRSTLACSSNSNATNYGSWAYVDGFGTTHPFPASLIVSSDANCYEGTQAHALATDQSGYLLTINSNGPTATLQDSTGNSYSLPLFDPIFSIGSTTGPARITDHNGNIISTDGKSTFTDTLGQAVMSYSSTTGTYTANGFTYTYTSSITYTYKTVGGGTATVTLNYQLYPGVRTIFGCSQGDIAVANIPLVNSIVYADGSQYSLTYEPTGSAYPGFVTGRIASVTLRTGGTISYSYGGDGSGSINCNDGTPYMLSRTTSDGTWTYARNVPTSGTSSTTTVTDPQGNQTVYTFQSGYQVEKQAYQGSVSSGTLLQTSLTCYNGNTNAATCSTTAVTPPITRTTNFVILPTNELSETNVVMSASNAATTEEDDYDFGSGAPGSLLRQTLTQYASLGNNILAPSSVTVKDGSGTQIAQTTYGYDETSLTTTSGLLQHTSVSGSRGNQTSMHRWLNTNNSMINSTFAYDDAGQILSTIDANGYTSSFNYGCSDSYRAQVTLPNTGVAHTTSAVYDCYTGLKTSDTDQNGKITSYGYDNLLREINISYPDGGQTNVSFPSPTQQVVQRTLNGSSSTYSSTQLDGLGRASRTIVANGESSPYDQQDTCYNALGLAGFASYTYQGSGFSSSKVCSGAGDSYTYNALGSPTQITHSDGSSIQYTQGIRTTQVTEEGNGSSNPSRITEVDGLGRPVIVCEVANTILMGSDGSPASCGLDISGSGFLTTYTYDALNNLTSVSQGAVNKRSYVYDSLSRLTSTTDPESGTTTYPAYDGDGNLLIKVDARNVTTNYSYDALGRLINKAYTNDPANTPGVHFSYDSAAGWSNPTVAQNNVVGRMSKAWVTNSAGSMIAGNVFGYDPMGRVTVNNQCTPLNCSSGNYPLTYTYDAAGNLTSITAGGVTLSYTYNVAGRLTNVSSSLVDSNHPGTLLSNAHYSLTQLTDNLGNGLSDTAIFSGRGLATSLTVQNTGLVSSPDDSAGNVAINGNLQSTTTQTQAATYARGSITISGSEPCPPVYGCEQGGVSITAGSTGGNVTYGSGSSANGIAQSLANQLSSSIVTNIVQGSTIYLTSASSGASGNYALSGSSSGGGAAFNGPAFTVSTSGATMTGGTNAVYSTKYDSGTCTITVNGRSDAYSWSGSTTTASSIASGLESAINADNAAYITASLPNPTTVALKSKQAGVSYPLSSSCSYDSTDFASASFSTVNSGANSGTSLALPVYSYALTEAPDGRVTGANDQLNGNWAFTYDPLNHLGSASKNSGQQTFSYGNDPFGNRLEQNAPQGGPAPQYTFDNNNHIVGSGITYDLAGNITADGLGNTFTWDAEGRLAQVNGGSTATYVYDAMGRRVQGPVGYYLYDLSDRAVAVLNGSGTSLYGEIYAGNRHLATYSNRTTNFIHSDWLGTKRVVTGVNGAILQTCTGLAFGDNVVCSGTSTTLGGFTDDMIDAETGLAHTWFRKYSPIQGGWLTPDPAGIAVSDPTNPQSWNRYAYVMGDPVNAVDPLGLFHNTDACNGNPCQLLIDQGGPGFWINFLPYCVGSGQGGHSSAAQCDFVSVILAAFKLAQKAQDSMQCYLNAQNQYVSDQAQSIIDGRKAGYIGGGAGAFGALGIGGTGTAMGLV